MIPTITVATDASYAKFHGRRIGAWACYIRTETQTVKTGGLLKDDIKGSAWAERFALANALFIAEKLCTLQDYRLIVYSDSMEALNFDRKHKTPQSKYYAQNQAFWDWYEPNIKPILDKAKSVDLRHVKGHLPESKWDTVSKRNYLNFWCDQHAKLILREEKKRIVAELKEI